MSKTFPMATQEHRLRVVVNVSVDGSQEMAGFEVSINGRFWVSTEVVRTESRLRLRTDRASVAGAASLELIHQQQVIVAGQRGVIMRGRRRHSDPWPPRREPISQSFEDVESDAQTDEALRALARLLARQAAREVFEREPAKGHSNHSSEEGQE